MSKESKTNRVSALRKSLLAWLPDGSSKAIKPLDLQVLEDRVLYSATPLPVDSLDAQASLDANLDQLHDALNGVSLAPNNNEQQGNTSQPAPDETVFVDSSLDDLAVLLQQFESEGHTEVVLNEPMNFEFAETGANDGFSDAVLLDSNADGIVQNSQFFADIYNTHETANTPKSGIDSSTLIQQSWSDVVTTTSDVVLIDTQLDDSDQLAASVKAGAVVFLYDGTTESASDLLSRITEWSAESHTDISTLSILSHGVAGGFELGNQWITTTTFGETAADWQALAQHFTEGANIYILGCNVGQVGSDGQQLLDALAFTTSADVFASDDITGVGGDWVLEVSSAGNSLEDMNLFQVFDIAELRATDVSLAWYNASWGYRQTVTINEAMVTGTSNLNNFAVLVSITNANLRSTGNGGHVGQTDGGDFVFTSADGTTKLDHQIESYNATTGTLLAWVEVPTLSYNVNTSLYLYYGNAAVADQWNVSGTWESNYQGIWHLGSDYADSTSNASNGTNNNASNYTNAEIGSGEDFNGTSSYVSTTNSAAKTANDFTLSLWFNADSTTFASHLLWQGQSTGNGFGGSEQEMSISLGSVDGSGNTYSNMLSFNLGDSHAGAGQIVIATPFSDTTNWHHVVVVVSNMSTTPTATMYLDGVSVGTDTGTTSLTSRTNWDTGLQLGKPGANQRYYDGGLDEVRVATTTRSSDWVLTEYNNQNAPTTFVTFSSEETAPAAPVLDNTKSPELTAQSEDSGVPVGAVGTLVSSLVDFASPAGQIDNVTDTDAGAVLGIAVTAANTTNGTWWYSTNSGTNWYALGSVSDASARLLAADATTRIYFTPNADYNGTIADAITFRAWDRTSGANGSAVSLYSTANATVRDNFDSQSYAGNNGTSSWTASWQEIGEADGATTGRIRVGSTGSVIAGPYLELDLTTSGRGISRAVDLTGAVSATVSFTYEQIDASSGGQVALQVFNGSTWNTIQTYSIDSNNHIGNVGIYQSFDISAYASASTAVRFYVVQAASGDFFRVDDVKVDYTFPVLNVGGTTAFSSATDTALLVVNAINDAPVLDNAGTMTLTTITEDQTTNAGNTVASIIASAGGDRITDVDSGAVEGMAITSLTSGNGTWQYSTNAGGSWTAIGGASNTSALLLRSTDLVRFLPNAQNGTTASFDFRAWDQSSGSFGTKVDVSTNGGTTAFSTATETANITVTSLNDAPTMSSVAMGSTNEDTTKAWQVSSFVGSSSDVDTGAVMGLAIVGVDDANGTWQYTLNGTNWFNIGSVSASNALLLASDATSAFRFVPNANWNGTTGMFQYKAWDQTSGTAGSYVDASISGGTTAFSGTSGSVLQVTADNDAPTITNGHTYNLTGTNEDTTSSGTLASTILTASTWADVDSGAVSGLAITGKTGNGIWQYSTDGTTWNSFGAVTPTNALLITSTTQVRYMPDAVNGETATFTYKAWDQTSGTASDNSTARFASTSSSGGSTAFSTNTDTAQMVVTSVNDAPAIAQLRDDAVAAYDFESGTGSIAAGGPSITVNSPVSISGSAGYTTGSSGLLFPTGDVDSTTNPVSISTIPGVATSNEFSFSAQVRFDAGTGDRRWERIFDFGSGSSRDNVLLSRNDTSNDLILQVWSGTTNVGELNITNALAGIEGQWHQYGVTINAAGLVKVFIDGSQVGAIQVASLPDYSTWDENYIGSSNWVNNKQFQGAMDDIGVFDRVLSAAEMKSLASTNTPQGFSIAENSANATSVGIIHGADLEGSTLIYSITSQDYAGAFTINSSTGEITVANSSLLDFETATSHNVTVRVSDGSLTSDEVFTISLTDVNDAPVVSSIEGTALSYTENDGAVAITSTITFTDVDDTNIESAVVQITGNYNSAEDVLSFVGQSGISGSYNATNGTWTLMGSATLAQYQTAIRSITYTNASENPNTTTRTVSITVNDGTDNSNTQTRDITIGSVNDDPTNAGSLPTDITVTEDVYSNVDLSSIDLSDVDASSGSLTVKLTTSTGGNLTAAAGTGITIGTNGTGAITLTGTLTNLNNYLNTASNVQYLHSTANTFGNDADTINVKVNDNGNTGSGGGSDQDFGTVNVDITAVNDAPINVLPGSRTVYQNGILTLSSAFGSEIEVTDVDASGASIQVSLSSTNGSLTLSGVGGLSFSVGDGSSDTSMSFTGTMAAINASLDGMTFTPTPNYSGVANITVTTNDQGNTGTGGALGDVDVIAINVIPANSVSLWLSTDKSATVSGGTTWTDGEVIDFAAPGLALEPGTTSGTFASVFDLDSFTADGNADISALHRVTRSVIVGVGGGSITLQKGDVLFSIEGNDTIGGVSVTEKDLVLYRPTVLDNYSSGTFSILINSPTGDKIREVALVEQNITIGGVALNAGDLLLVQSGGTYDKDVWRLQATSVGGGTTAGTFTEFIDGADIGFSQQIGGLALVETTTTMGNVTLNSGELLLNLRNDTTVGTNNLSVTKFDIFRLNVSQAGTTTVATASLLFQGADVGLSSGGEEFHGLALVATNYAPTLAGANNFTSIAEDAFTSSGTLVSSLISGQVSDPDEGAISGIAVTSVDNSNGTWQYSINNGGSWNNFSSPTASSARLLASDGSTLIRFVPNANYNGNASITYRAWDQTTGNIGSTADTTTNGGASAFSSATANSTITVTPVNDAPVLDNSGTMTLSTITEDQTANGGNTVASIVASAGGNRITDVDSGAVEGIAITSLSSGNGTWEYSTNGGGTWASIGTVSSTSALLLRDSDLVRFVPNAVTGSTASFDFKAWDQTSGTFGTKVNASTGGGITAFSTAIETANITVTDVNDAPVNTVPGTRTVAEETTAGISGISIADVDAASGNLTTRLLVSNGVLNVTLSGSASISAGSNATADLTIQGTVTDINATLASLTYTGNPDVVGTAADTLTITTNDGGNTGAGGALQDVDNIQIDITAVNDAPVVSAPGSALAATEQVGLAIHGAGFSVSDVDEAGIGATATISVGEGTLTVAAGNSGITIDSGNGTGAVTISGSIAQINNLLTAAGTGTITYLNNSDTPSASTTVTVTVNDQGNTGADPGLTGNGTSEEGTNSQTINITATNDDPTNAGSLPSDITVTEDVSSNVDLSSINLSDVDHGGGNLTVTLTTSTGGNLSATTGGGVTIGGSGTGVLTLTGTLANLNTYLDNASNLQYLHSTANLNGNDADTISVKVNDNGNTGTGGGTDIALGTVNIDITAVNDAPELNNAATFTLTGITEDNTTNAGNTVAEIIASQSGDRITDIDNSAVEGIAIRTASTTNGTWQYQLDGTGTWTNVGSVSTTSSLLLTSADRLRFLPNAQNGTTATIEFVAWDQTAGTAGATANTTTTGGITAFSDNQGTAEIVISDINDAPTLTDLAVVNLTGTNEDTPSPGTSVTSVLSAAGYGDVDSSAAKGVAVTSISGNGTWQYSLDGTNWTAFGPVSDSAALYLSGATQVRYQPDTLNGETATFGFVAWDQTTGSASTFGSPSLGDSTTRGGTNAHSSETASASIVVTDINDAVVAVADADSAVEAGGFANATAGSNATGNLLANDLEVDSGDSLNVIGVAAGTVASASGNIAASVTGTYGSLTVNADGSYTYVVDESNSIVQALRTSGESVSDTFTYTVQDSGSATSSTQIVITITGQNDAPTAVADATTAIEAGGVNNASAGTNPTGNVLTNDNDPDAGDTKTVIGVDAGVQASASTNVGSAVTGTYGSITINANGSYTYNVDNNNATVQALRTASDTITDVFTYTMQDTDGLSSTTQITVTIQGKNDDLLAVDDTILAAEAGGTANGTPGTNPTGNVLTNDTDVDTGDSKTVFGVAAGSQATASGNVGSGVVGSYGTLNIDASGNYSYTVDNSNAAVQALRTSGQTISEVFTYTVQDNFGAASTAHVTVTISGENDAPVAVANAATAIEASGIYNNISGTNPTGNVLTNDTDVDAGDTKTVVGVATGVQGSTSGSVGATVTGTYGSIVINANGTYTYTLDNDNAAVEALNAGDTLSETFSYTVEDTNGLNSTTQIVITIDGRTDLPVAEADMATAVEDGGVANAATGSNPSGNVLDNDVSGNGKTVIGVAAGSTGTASGNVGTIVNGLYGTVVINSDGTYTYTLDNDNPTVQALLTSGDHVTDIFTYTMKDTFDNESSTELTITVDGANDAPEAVDDTADATEAGGLNNATPGSNATGNVLTNDTDVDSGDTKSVTGVAAGVVASPAGSVGASVAGTYGSIVINGDGSFTFVINENNAAVQALRTSSDTLQEVFSYQVEDTSGLTSTAQVTITIHGSNDAPTAVLDLADAYEDGGGGNSSPGSNPTGNVLTNDTDIDAGDTKSVIGVLAGTQLSASGNVGSGVAGSYGAIVINGDGSYTYTVDNNNAAVQALRTAGDTLSDFFTYTMTDTNGLTSSTQVQITVHGANENINAVADTATAVEASGTANGTAGVNPTGNVLANDTDADSGDTKNISGVAAGVVSSATGNVGASVAGLYGSINIASDGSYAYVVNNNHPGVQALLSSGDSLDDVFTYTVQDAAGAESTTQITVTIQGADDAPVAFADFGNASEAGGLNNSTGGSDATGNVLANDAQVDAGDSWSVTGVDAGTVGTATGPVGSAVGGNYGSLQVDANGGYSYVIDQNNASVQALRTNSDTLSDVFSYTVKDASGQASTTQITITIRGNNDAPVAVADTSIAVEAGGYANATAGTNPTGNVLTNDTDVDSGDTKNISGVVAGVAASASGNVGSAVMGTYGDITIASNGSYSYIVDNNNATVQALRNNSESLDDVFSYTTVDASGATSTTQITVTIQGSNDAPTISVQAGDSMAESLMETDTTLISAGTLTVSDIDLSDVVTSTVSGVVASGNTTGLQSNNAALLAMLTSTASILDNTEQTDQLTWGFNSGGEAFDYLAVGESLTLTYTITVTDIAGLTATQDITLTINGTNDTPVVGVQAGDSAADTLTESNTALTSSGTLTVSDLDLSDVVTSTVSSVVASGTTTGLGSNNAALLAMVSSTANVLDGTETTNTLTWDFNSASEAFDYLALGETLTLTYTITVTDSQGAVDTQDVTITINGTNDAPLVSLQVGDSSADSLNETNATLTSTGTLTVDDLDLSDAVASTVSGLLVTGTTTGLQSNNSALLAMLSSTANVIDGTELTNTLTWNFNSGSEAFDYLAVGESLTLTYTITVTDSQGATDSQDVTITINGTNDQPIVLVQVGNSAENMLAETNTTLASSGTLTITDLDLSDAVTASVSGVVASGTTTGLQSNNAALLAMLASTANVLDGSEVTDQLTWDFDSGSEAFDYLAVGESLTLTYTITVTDSQGASDTQDVTITINGTNDTPIVTVEVGDSVAKTLTEANATLATAGTLTVGDTDLSDAVTSSVSSVVATGTTTGLQSNNAALLAMLSSTANVLDGTQLSNVLSWGFNSGSETFDYLAVGESLTLTYTITVTDSQGATDTQDVTITINGTNDAPLVSAQVGDSSGSTMTENGSPVSSSGTLTVDDLDLSDAVNSTVSSVVATGTTNGLASSNAALLAMLSSTASVIDGTELSDRLTWNFNSGSEVFDYLAVGESLTLTYTITVTDSQGVTDTQAVNITINGGSNAPVISLEVGDSAADTLTETDSTLTTSGTLTVSDLDLSDVVTSAVSSVVASGTTTGLGSNNAALLAMLSSTANVLDGTETTNTLTWDFNSASEAFDYLALGETLTLTYTITVTDSQGAVDTQDVTITINGTNDAPLVSLQVGDSSADSLNETNATLTSTGTLTVDDLDLSDAVASTVSGLLVTGTTTGLQSNNSALLAMLSSTANVIDGTELTNTLTWNFNSGSEAFDYLAVGESLTLTYTITVTDSQGATDSQDVTITINGTNDAAVLATIEATALSYTENDGAVAVSSTLTLADIDDAQLESAVVAISGNYVNGEDLLSFVDQNGITGVWNATNGTLTLTGPATRANFEAALRSVAYTNIAENPSTASRIVSFTVNDGDDDSATRTRDISITAVNDEQVLSTNTGATFAENSTGNSITSSMLTTTDVDNSTGELVYTVTAVPLNGTLRLNGGVLAASSTFSQNDIDLGNISYDHDGSETAMDGFSFTVDDGSGTVSSGVFSIAITPVNDNSPIIISNGGGSTASIDIAENSTIVTTIVATDADLPVGSITFSINGGADAGLFQIDANTGELSFISGRDRENFSDADLNGIYEVNVVASDGTLFDAQLISVNVTDVDEYDLGSISDANATNNFVQENAALGTLVGLTAHATDADATNNAVTYSLTDDDQGRFVIDSVTGEVRVNGQINYEAIGGSRTVRVQATSSDGSTSSFDFTILIGDVNEAPLAVADHYTTSYIRNLILSSPGFTSNDSDPDGNPITAQLVQGPSSGLVTFGSDGSLIYSPQSGFVGDVTLQYYVTDGQLNSALQTIVIQVTFPTSAPPPDSGGNGGGTGAGSGSGSIGGGSGNTTASGNGDSDGPSDSSPTAPAVAPPPTSSRSAAVQGAAEASTQELALRSARSLQSVAAIQFANAQPANFPLYSAGFEANEQELSRLELSEVRRLVLAEAQTAELMFTETDRQIEGNTQADWFHQIDPLVATALGTGVVIWLVHAGQVAAALLTTASVWVQVDPLTVLQGINPTDQALTSEEKLFDNARVDRTGEEL